MTTWHHFGDLALFGAGTGFMFLWLRDRYRWLRLRAVMMSDETRIDRLEKQHDLAQDAVAAANAQDRVKLAVALTKLEDTFRAERGLVKRAKP